MKQLPIEIELFYDDAKWNEDFEWSFIAKGEKLEKAITDFFWEKYSILCTKETGLIDVFYELDVIGDVIAYFETEEEAAVFLQDTFYEDAKAAYERSHR